ncbi:hypothetical protein JCM1840_007197 [Sporobolomyces johnsonii]
MAFRLLRRDPSLIPLFVAAGAGVLGAVGFGIHYLRNNPDVVIKKSRSRDPWNDVHQGQNTKLFSYNPSFWASRTTLENPRAMFQQPGGPELKEGAAVAKARAVRAAKEKTEAGREQSGEIGRKVMGNGNGFEDGKLKESTVEH